MWAPEGWVPALQSLFPTGKGWVPNPKAPNLHPRTRKHTVRPEWAPNKVCSLWVTKNFFEETPTPLGLP